MAARQEVLREVLDNGRQEGMVHRVWEELLIQGAEGQEPAELQEHAQAAKGAMVSGEWTETQIAWMAKQVMGGKGEKMKKERFEAYRRRCNRAGQLRLREVLERDYNRRF